MNIEEIKKNAPDGATHYMDDEKGFDYIQIEDDFFVAIWCSRFECWLPIGYVELSKNYKPL